MRLELAVNVTPSDGIIMNKDARIPRPLERPGSSVKAFAAFVKEYVTAGQCNLVRPALEVFDEDRPRLGVVLEGKKRNDKGGRERFVLVPRNNSVRQECCFQHLPTSQCAK